MKSPSSTSAPKALIQFLTVIIFMASCCRSQPSSARVRIDGSGDSALRQIIENSIDTQNGGVCASLFSGDGQIWEYRSERENGIAMNSNSPVYPGGLSGQFAAIALLKLCSQNKIREDAALSEYLPDVFNSSLGGEALLSKGGIKVSSLLAESTGYDDQPPALAGSLRADSLASRAMRIKPLCPPDLRRTESSLMVDLGEMLVQNVSGQPFANYMDMNLFGPLGMDSSSFSTEAPERNLFFHSDGSPYAYSEMGAGDLIEPSCSMRTSTHDLMLCYSVLLRLWNSKNPEAEEKGGILPSCCATMFSPAIAGQLDRQAYQSGRCWLLSTPGISYLGPTARAQGQFLSHRTVVLLARRQNIGIVISSSVYSRLGCAELEKAAERILAWCAASCLGCPIPRFVPPQQKDIPAELLPKSELYASTQGVAQIGLRGQILGFSFNGSYAEFAYQSGQSFLPVSDCDFSGLDVGRSASLILHWKSGARTVFNPPRSGEDAFILTPQTGIQKDSNSSYFKPLGVFSIRKRAEFYTITAGDGREYLIVPQSGRSASVFCDDGSVFKNKELRIAPDGVAEIADAGGGR